MSKRAKYPSHLVIPDTQHEINSPGKHLLACGRYILDKRPEEVIHLGDIGDFGSLSMYDSPAAKGFDQVDFGLDAEAAELCADLITYPVRKWNKSHPKRKQYHPRWTLLEGNHCGQTGAGRIARAVRDQPWLRGVMLDRLDYAQFGWRTIPFLVPEIIDSICYAHFFCMNAKGGVTKGKFGQPSAHQQVVRVGMSATAGHRQGLDTHIQPRVTGTRQRGIIAGSFYVGDEATKYLTPQGVNYWRGVLHCHEVRDGDYDLSEVSLAYLLRRWS